MTNTFVTQELAAAHIRQLQQQADQHRLARSARAARVSAAAGHTDRARVGRGALSAWTRSLTGGFRSFLDAGQLGPAYRARCW